MKMTSIEDRARFWSEERVLGESLVFLTKMATVRLMCKELDEIINKSVLQTTPILMMPPEEWTAFVTAVYALKPFGINTGVFLTVEKYYEVIQRGIVGRCRDRYDIFMSKDVIETKLKDQ